MDDVLKRLENVLNDEDGFFIKVRNLDGVDDEKFKRVLDALKQVELFYMKEELVPKYLFYLTSALVSSLWGMIDSYNQPMREKIFVAIDKLDDALNKCFRSERFSL